MINLLLLGAIVYMLAGYLVSEACLTRGDRRQIVGMRHEDQTDIDWAYGLLGWPIMLIGLIAGDLDA